MATREGRHSTPLVGIFIHHRWFFFSADAMRRQEKGLGCAPRRILTPADVQKLRISSFKTKPQHTTDSVIRLIVDSRRAGLLPE